MTRLISRIALAAALVLALAVGSAMAEISGDVQFTGHPVILTGHDGSQVYNTNDAYGVTLTLRSASDMKGPSYGGIEGYLPSAQELLPIIFWDATTDSLCTELEPDILIPRVGDIHGYAFTLDGLTGLDKGADGLGLILHGYGKVTYNGLDETPGDWSITVSQSTSVSDLWSWQANFHSPTDTPTVPEPTTLVLLGTGLLGAAVLARRNRKQ